MAGNFVRVRSYIYINGNVIQALENNTNENNIFEGHNSSMNELTGHQHTGAPGDAPLLDQRSFDSTKVFGVAGLQNAILKLTAGRLTLTTKAGTAPSATDPIRATLPIIAINNPPNVYTSTPTTISIESADHVTIDDASSADSFFVSGGTGSPMGTTAGRAWSSFGGFTTDVPIMGYVCTDGVTPIVFLSRQPNLTVTPGSTLIGYKNSPPAVSAQSNIFAFTATDIRTSHSGVSCWPIFSVRMTKNASDDWTFSLLDASDGIGVFFNFGGRILAMPSGQNGAAAGSWFSVAAGTAPTYNTALSRYFYLIDMNGMIHVDFLFNTTVVAGVGANPLTLGLPIFRTLTIPAIFGSGQIQNGAGLQSHMLVKYDASGSTGITFFYQSTIVTALTAVQGVDQNAGGNSFLYGSLIYRGF